MGGAGGPRGLAAGEKWLDWLPATTDSGRPGWGLGRAKFGPPSESDELDERFLKLDCTLEHCLP